MRLDEVDKSEEENHSKQCLPRATSQHMSLTLVLLKSDDDEYGDDVAGKIFLPPSSI